MEIKIKIIIIIISQLKLTDKILDLTKQVNKERFKISYEELQLDYPTENDIFLGYTYISENETIVKSITAEYTKLIDTGLKEFNEMFISLKQKYPKIWKYIKEKEIETTKKLMKIRGINYEEFVELFTIKEVKNINPLTEEIESSIFFHPLWKDIYSYYIADKQDLMFITSKYKPDLENYLKFLEDFGMFNLKEILNFFLPVFLKEEYFERHAYITGMTGSGKSELIKLLVYGLSFNKIPFKTNILQIFSKNKLKKNKSIVVIDPHGDLAEQISKWKEFTNKENFENLVYIDPFLDKEYIPVLNPFDIKDKSETNIDILAQELTKVFQELIKDSKLTLQMETLLNPCISTLLRRKNSTLRDLQRFMNDELNKDLVEEGLNSPNPAHRDFFKYAFYNKTYTPTKQSIFTKIQSLLNSKIFHNLVIGKSTIDLEKLINEKKIIIFNLSKGKLGTDTSEAFGRLIIALLNFIALKRADIPEDRRIRTFLFIDEFQNYISKSIETTLTENRKYKLFMVLSQQILGQGMNTQMKNIILSNTFVKFIGMNALNTLKALSNETGIELEKLQNLDKGEFYTKIGNKPAFKFKTATFLLGNKNSMKQKEWEKLKKFLLENYYQKPNNNIKIENTKNPDNYTNKPKKQKLKPKFEL